ncbi:MAG: type II toxin-antitoxin system VapC family toxin, partial [Thermodesulfobacteriota bacterium]
GPAKTVHSKGARRSNPMGGRFLLDTNIVIGLLAAEPAVTRPLQAVEEVFLPSIVLGELYYGALKSKRTAQNLAGVDALTAAAAVLPCDADTAREYGRIKNGLRALGQPIPENDIWIAALPVQHGLILATRDPHFDRVERLQRVRWD